MPQKRLGHRDSCCSEAGPPEIKPAQPFLLAIVVAHPVGGMRSTLSSALC
jgi:hypothetical protein